MDRNICQEMKYLKKYKLFENSKYTDIINDLNDILLDASDLNYKTNVNYYSNSNNQIIQVETSIYTVDESQYLDLKSLNDCIERVIYYTKSTGLFYNPTAYISHESDYLEIKNKPVGWKQLDNTHPSSDELSNLNLISVNLKFNTRQHLYESNIINHETFKDI